MVRRYGISLGIGAAITFALLFIMQLLIATERGPDLNDRSPHTLDMVRVERTPIIKRKEPKPDRPPEPERQPEQPRSSMSDNINAGIAVSMTTPAVESGRGIGELGFGISDGDLLPLVKPTPLYPTRAARLGLEGYAIVEYTVTKTGTTEGVRVVGSSDPVFEKSCVDAARQFKYRPRVIDGEEIEVDGVQNRCTFQLEE